MKKYNQGEFWKTVGLGILLGAALGVVNILVFAFTGIGYWEIEIIFLALISTIAAVYGGVIGFFCTLFGLLLIRAVVGWRYAPTIGALIGFCFSQSFVFIVEPNPLRSYWPIHSIQQSALLINAIIGTVVVWFFGRYLRNKNSVEIDA